MRTVPTLPVLAGALIAAATFLGGCANDTDTDEALQGVWENRYGMFMTFEDGTWNSRVNPERWIAMDEAPFDSGTYTVDAATLTLTHAWSDEVVPSSNLTCPEGSVGVYEVDMADDEAMFVLGLVEDTCASRAENMGRTWVEVDPEAE